MTSRAPATKSPGDRRRWRTTSALFAALVVATAIPFQTVGASSLGPSNFERHDLALAQARVALSLAPLPAHATVLSSRRATRLHALAHPMSTPADPDQVDLTRFYQAPQGSRALAWLNARRVQGRRRSQWGTSSGPRVVTLHELTFSLNATAVLPDPELEYTMFVAPDGQLWVRVDAIVSWTPRKSPFALVPAGASKVLVVLNRAPVTKSRPVTTFVVTASAAIDRLIQEVSELPVATPGVHSCPIDRGTSLTLSFFRPRQRHAYARVFADTSGCATVRVSEFRRGGVFEGAALLSGALTLASQVERTLHPST